MSKLQVTMFENEPRWCLGDVPVEEHNVIMHRKGIETIGHLTCDGDEPPGIPVFEFIINGQQDINRVLVDVQNDEFRFTDEFRMMVRMGVN